MTEDLDERALRDYYNSFEDLTDNDIELFIIHLQYLRVKRKRDWHEENYKPYKFCDACSITHPYFYDTCLKCGSDKLRALPIFDKFSYLLDDHIKLKTEGSNIQVNPRPNKKYYPN